MDILYIVPYTPNLIRVRPYHLVRSLARAGHRVTVATVWTTVAERADLERLAAEGVQVLACRLPFWRSGLNCVRALPTRLPLQAAYCWQPALTSAVRRALRTSRFDVVHVEHLRGALYGLKAARWLATRQHSGRGDPAFGARQTAVVWDSVDCISHLFTQAARGNHGLKGRLISRLELERTRQYEAWLVGQFDRVLVTSEVDRHALLELSARSAPISVLSNGVDLDYFTPTDEPREPATLVITGKMSYHANVTAVLHLVRQIMPRVWARRPDVKVWIAGKDPAPEIRALSRWDQLGERATGVPSSASGGRVIVTGTVADIRPYLRRATVAMAAIPYGAGIQNKVLEAMACGAPVVASRQAISALAVQPGRDVLMTDDAETSADAVLALLDAPERRQQLGRAGRAYVETNHAWDAITSQLAAIYETAVTSGSRRVREAG
jgi:glycosyltransferase involved in cell wall biosynthesis